MSTRPFERAAVRAFAARLGRLVKDAREVIPLAEIRNVVRNQAERLGAEVAKKNRELISGPRKTQ